jgi:DNA-binding NarL/FixJ family response regulator
VADPPDVFVRRRAANTAVAAQDLTSIERAVLTLAAKPRRAAEVAAQLGQDPSATNHILRRLFAVDLLVRADVPSPRASTAVVVEERRASRDALVGFLHRVPYVTAVVGLSPDECTVEQVSHHGPRIVVVGIEGLSDPGAWITRLRVACPDVLVVGIARPSTSGAHTECTDCDGTLVEPVIDDELIDFIREA